MATSRGKTSPEVALLVRRVEMDERFKVDKKSATNKVNILGPKGEPLIIGLEASGTDIRRAERALERMGLRSADQPEAPQVRQRVTTRPAVDPYPNVTIYEKAKKVHKGATDYARATGKSVGLYDGVEFFIIDDKPLSYFVAKHYSKIQHYAGPGGKQEIYDFLRSTGNYARERDDDDTSIMIIRATFAEPGGAPVLFRSPRKAVSDWERDKQRKDARLTPQEAGEDREPGPVTIRQKPVEPTEPAPENAVIDLDKKQVIPVPVPTPPRPSPEDQRLLAEAKAREASLTCPECKAEGVEFVAKNPQGLSGHRRANHGIQGTTYKPSVVGKIEPGSPLADVGTAFDMLRDALNKVTAEADHSACEIDLAQATEEAEFQAADAQVQRRRAERAEETLHLIWTAFNEYPQHKAVAEILPLLPPMKD